MKELKELKEYEKWVKKLEKLNDHINSLHIWNSYAEDCQREYDFLLQQNPKLEKDK